MQMNKKAIHGKTIFKSNLATDIRVAHQCGFTGIEIVDSKLYRFLEQGNTTDDLNKILDKYQVVPVCINDICHVETDDAHQLDEILKATDYLSKAAQEINCPTIQLVPLLALEGRPWEEIVQITGHNVGKIGAIGKQYGIRFQMEPVAWSPINSLSKCLEMIEVADEENVGMVVDFWHLWAGGETSPDEVAKLDKSMIYNIHFCDGKRQPRDTQWDETILRGYYPGEGDIPLGDWVDAVKSTGYDGFWSCELVSAKHWEDDVFDVASTMSKALDSYIFNA
jgi:sugar phosphate isomerase/epimerase